MTDEERQLVREEMKQECIEVLMRELKNYKGSANWAVICSDALITCIRAIEALK